MTAERDYSDSPYAALALEFCPWRTTDHLQPGAYNGTTYCTWCDGFVAGATEVGKTAIWLITDGEEGAQ